jgi:hypothetical protein
LLNINLEINGELWLILPSPMFQKYSEQQLP